MISNHGVRGRKVGVGAVEKLVGTKTMAWRREKIFLFGHSEDLNPARIPILPQGSFVPGILNNIQHPSERLLVLPSGPLSSIALCRPYPTGPLTHTRKHGTDLELQPNLVCTIIFRPLPALRCT